MDSEVAPHGGAWIETFVILIMCTSPLVAPHGGAWIETFHLEHMKQNCY